MAESPVRLFVTVLGRGDHVLRQLAEAGPPAVNLFGARVSRSTHALNDWLGLRTEITWDEPTARALAMASFCHLLKLDRGESPPEGLAGAAIVQSLPGERGDDSAERRVHISIQTWNQTYTSSLVLGVAGTGTGAEVEDEHVIRFFWHRLALQCEIEHAAEISLPPAIRLGESRVEGEPEWRDLVCGGSNKAVPLRGFSRDELAIMPRAIFPGAFDPLHDGHRRMREIAEEMLGNQVAWELSVENVDKPLLDYMQLAARLSQFDASQPVWLTRAPTFVEKATLFPQATFVVGADTLARVADPRYYGGDVRVCQNAIDEMVSRRCRFLVFGRTHEGAFRTLENLSLPPQLRSLCQEVSPQRFRDEISSTALRHAGYDSE